MARGGALFGVCACLVLAVFPPYGSTFQYVPVSVAQYAHSQRMVTPHTENRGFLAARSLAPRATLTSMENGLGAQSGDNWEEKKREFELNRGFAVDTLLADYASLFDSAPNFDIFDDRVILKDTQGFTIEGKKSYKLFFRTVTNILSLVFSDCSTSVVLMDKYGIDKSKIKMRWRIELRSRLRPKSWKQLFKWFDRNGDGIISPKELNAFSESRPNPSPAHSWRTADTNDGPLVLEGISEYKLDAKGFVYEHVISITYPAAPWSFAPLQELLPIRRVAHPGLAGVGGMFAIPDTRVIETCPVPADVFAVLFMPMEVAVDKDFSSKRDSDVMMAKQNKQDEGEGFFASLLPNELKKKIPKQCKEDYDCNPGGFNYPLICADFVVARFCIDPDDWRGGGLGAHAWDPNNIDDMIKVPIPVRPGDGYNVPPGY